MEKVPIDDQVYDPAEETLLIGLEELAQKTQVLANWADEMYESVKAIPQSTSCFDWMMRLCSPLDRTSS
jgi:serine/threonine-protein kinase ULK/ATG1